MNTIINFIGLTLGSSLGWWLGSYHGFTLALVLSTVGSILGLYVVRKLADRYLE
jgi:uncharacterized membrane protein YeaQ/YmgE (transglycosylase-associated protein family)